MGDGLTVSPEAKLQHIAYCLEKELPDYDDIGLITKEGYVDRYVRGVWTHNNKPRLLRVIKYVNDAFALTEQKGIKVFNTHVPNSLIKAELEAYQRRYAIYFRVVNNLQKEVLRLDALNDPELKKELHKLKCFEIGLRYNLGTVSGGVNGKDAKTEPDPDALKFLCGMTLEWKKKQKPCHKHEINELELTELKTAAKYPEWVEVLKENKSYQNEFLKWTISNYNPPEVFIKYFAMQRKMKASLLMTYTGYSRDPANETIAIRTVATKTEGIAKRVLMLPFYDGSFEYFEAHKQKWVNILRPTNLIHFEKGNYWMTVEEFMKKNAKKDLREINVNLCANWGYTNFHPVHGVWDVDKQTYPEKPHDSELWTPENWIPKTPPMRIASKKEIEDKYGEQIKDKKFFYQVRATRTDLNLKALGCHGFMQLYISMNDGNWKVLNVGVYAYRFQQNLWEAIQMFGDTLKRVFALIDQNGTYTHRQRAAMSFFPTEEKGKELTDLLYHKLLRTHGVFQLAARNCAFGIQSTVNSVLNTPINFYRMRLTGATSGISLIDIMLRWADKRVEWLGSLALTFIHRILGSHRTHTIIEETGVTSYSMKEFLSKEGNVIYNPAYLLHQIEQAKKTGQGPFVNGELYWGNTEERLPSPLSAISVGSVVKKSII